MTVAHSEPVSLSDDIYRFIEENTSVLKKCRELHPSTLFVFDVAVGPEDLFGRRLTCFRLSQKTMGSITAISAEIEFSLYINLTSDYSQHPKFPGPEAV